MMAHKTYYSKAFWPISLKKQQQQQQKLFKVWTQSMILNWEHSNANFGYSNVLTQSLI